MSTLNDAMSQVVHQLVKNQISGTYTLEALHTYTDSQGQLLYWRIRVRLSNGEKWIRPMYQDSDGRYRLGEPPTIDKHHKPLYGLEGLGKFPEAQVIVVEGEWAADTLNTFIVRHDMSTDYVVVTSGSASSANTADWSPLAGKECLLWPDYDEPGDNYMRQVYIRLNTIGCAVYVIDTVQLGLAIGGDCVDWFRFHLDASMADLLALSRKSKQELEKETTLQGQDCHATAIKHLVDLSPIEYDQVRTAEAKKLNVRPATLDSEVKKARQQLTSNDDLPFIEIEPWHATVELAELLTDITDTVLRFIACKPEIAQTAALWIAMTWFIDDVNIAPLAIITAPEKRCGKSQLLTVISRLVYRPLMASNITPAALFRSIDEWQPTLLIDEADAFMRENEELRGIINAGHTRDSAYVIRVVGDEHHPKRFNVWGAKAIAGIGKLADTLMDRGIILELRRKLDNEHVERLRHADSNLFGTLSAKLARAAVDYAPKICCARPALPEHLNDRAQDNWEPLLAIADVAGGTWPNIARHAALILSASHEQSKSINIELLEDLQDIFVTRRWQRAPTKMLLEALCTDPEKPWATFNKGQALTPRQLSTMLSEFGIKSGTIRLDSSMTLKGYSLNQFEDAFMRYLQSTVPEEVTTSQPVYHQTSDVTFVLPVTDIKVTSNIDVTSNTNTALVCDAVTPDTSIIGESQHNLIKGEN